MVCWPRCPPEHSTTPDCPAPDSPLALTVTRAVALLALVVSAVYLTWRASSTLNLAGWYLAIPLLVLEIHAAIGLGLFTFSLWDVDRRPKPGSPDPRLSIAVLIPTYNEGEEILLPTRGGGGRARAGAPDLAARRRQSAGGCPHGGCTGRRVPRTPGARPCQSRGTSITRWAS